MGPADSSRGRLTSVPCGTRGGKWFRAESRRVRVGADEPWHAIPGSDGAGRCEGLGGRFRRRGRAEAEPCGEGVPPWSPGTRGHGVMSACGGMVRRDAPCEDVGFVPFVGAVRHRNGVRRPDEMSACRGTVRCDAPDDLAGTPSSSPAATRSTRASCPPAAEHLVGLRAGHDAERTCPERTCAVRDGPVRSDASAKRSERNLVCRLPRQRFERRPPRTKSRTASRISATASLGPVSLTYRSRGRSGIAAPSRRQSSLGPASPPTPAV